ncbi:MAG: alanine racemase [bacterium]
MTRPTRAEICMASLRHNLELIWRRSQAEGTEPPEIIPVVKADAYGHGAVEVSRRLLGFGVKWLAVACLEEAIELDEAGLFEDGSAGVIILGPLISGELEEIAARGFVPVISDRADLEKIESEAPGEGLRAVLYLDTGMGRTGILAEQANEVCDRVRKMEGLEIVGLFSHFPAADGIDEEDRRYTEAQIEDFRLLSQTILESFPDCRLLSIANSSGIFYHPRSAMNAVRPGICLYGVRPASDLEEPGELRPVMRWTTRIVQVRELPAGAFVSYGRKTVLKRPSRLALLPVGYADGLSRRLPPGFPLSVRARPAPLTGVVTMDLTVIDITDIPEARLGDRVLLMGRESGRRLDEFGEPENALTEIPAEVHAREAGTIPYEILTSVGPRVKREYIEDE